MRHSGELGKSSKADEMDELEDDPDEYYVIPAEAIQYLPSEWREQLQAMADDGRAILKSVDSELSQLSRLTFASIDLVTLKYVKQRLADYRFEPTMEAILENEMLVTAFVITYTRLQQGGVASGFAKGALPRNLHKFHDEIIELRDKRFAHNAGHHTIREASKLEVMSGCAIGDLNCHIQLDPTSPAQSCDKLADRGALAVGLLPSIAK